MHLILYCPRIMKLASDDKIYAYDCYLVERKTGDGQYRFVSRKRFETPGECHKYYYLRYLNDVGLFRWLT
jgi:hypothetical protein